MRRTFAVLLVALLLFCLTACQSGGNNVELEAMKKQMQMMQQQLDEAKQAGYNPPAPAAASTPEPTLPAPTEDESGDLVLALHSTIDGETSLFTDGATELVATAVIPEGMAVDYWELNGEPYYEDMEDTFLFTAQGNTVVDAKLRPERKVTAINAEMQFLDERISPREMRSPNSCSRKITKTPSLKKRCLVAGLPLMWKQSYPEDMMWITGSSTACHIITAAP